MIVGLPGSVILRLALAWLTYTDARLWRPLRATLISALFPSPSLVTASPTVPEASDLSKASLTRGPPKPEVQGCCGWLSSCPSHTQTLKNDENPQS